MKYIWTTVAVVLGLAALAASMTYHCVRGDMQTMTEHDRDSLQWLRHEFKLTPEQIARIEKLHADYHGVCEGHCRAIMETREKIAALRSSGASQTELEAANEQAIALDVECRNSVREHVRTVAGVIGGEQGERYLRIVLSNLDTFSHQGPLDLKLDARAAHDAHSSR